jgi:hypothetical protein
LKNLNPRRAGRDEMNSSSLKAEAFVRGIINKKPPFKDGRQASVVGLRKT